MVALRKLATGTARARRTERQNSSGANAPTMSLAVSPLAPPSLVSPAPPNEALAQPKRNSNKAPFDNDTRYVPSQGSKNHCKGQCRPCRNNETTEGCSKGVSCNCCHCWHSDEKFLNMAVCSAVAHARRAMQKDERLSRKELQNNVLVPVMLMESQASPTQQDVADQQIIPSKASPAPPLMQGPTEECSRCTFPEPPNKLEMGGAFLAVQQSHGSGSHFQCQPCGLSLVEGTLVFQMQSAPVTVVPTHAAETSQHAAAQQILSQQMQQADGVQMSQTGALPFMIDAGAQMHQGALPQNMNVEMQLPQWAPLQVMQTDVPTPQQLQDMQTKVVMSQDAPRYDRQGEGQRMQVKKRLLRHAGPVSAGYQWIQNVQHCGNGDLQQHPQKCQMEPGVHMSKLVHSFWPGCASQSTEELMQTLRDALPAYYDE